MKDIDMGLVGDRALWDIPLPPCPKCGGNLVWFEAGHVPGMRKCKTCRELYLVMRHTMAKKASSSLYKAGRMSRDIESWPLAILRRFGGEE